MATTYTLIASSTVGSGGASSVTFSSIPSTYTDLLVKVSARSPRTNDSGGSDGKLEFNGATTGFSSKGIFQQGSAGSASPSSIFYFISDDAQTANTFGNMEVYIPNYTSSNTKTVSLDAVTENNATSAYSVLISGLWTGTSAITSMKFTDNNGGFNQNSTFYLYGIKKS
jgi:hypothetical protein